MGAGLGGRTVSYDFNNVTTTARRPGDKFILKRNRSFAVVDSLPWTVADRLGAHVGRTA